MGGWRGFSLRGVFRETERQGNPSQSGQGSCRPGKHVAVLVAIGFALCGSIGRAQQVERPIREAFIVETDGIAEKKLATVGEYVKQQQWEAAISLIREVATSRPGAVVRVSPNRSMSLPRYCDLLLAQLPPEGLKAYRREVDAQAEAWWAEADETGDDRPLRSISERAFASSLGDDATMRLAERAWKRGEIDLARRYWTLLVPLGPANANEASLLAVLRYPDTDQDLAGVRARLVVCSIALGELNRAEQELAAFEQMHGDATGWLGGREGRLGEILKELIEDAHGASSGSTRGGWDVLPRNTATRTFATSSERGGVLVEGLGARVPLWQRALPRSEYATDSAPPALSAFGPLSFYPVVWQDKVFVADAANVHGFELETGLAAWGVGDEDRGVLYPIVSEGPEVVSKPVFPGPLLGVPRHTLTVAGDRLYARLGPPVTSWPGRAELRRTESTIVCLDLARQGLLAWSLSSERLGAADEWWAFESPPVEKEGRLYVLATRNRPQARLSALCLDGATGEVLWNRPVGAPIATPPEGATVMTHRLVTIAAGRLYIQTNEGAIGCLNLTDGQPIWFAWYESQPSREGRGGSRPEKHLPGACLFAGGVVVAAPNDSDRVYAYDAASGVELWSRVLRDGARQLLGAQNGVLAVSGRRLWGLDLFTGRELWSAGFEDPPGYGVGRGLIAGGSVYWPTREDLFKVDLSSGQITERVPLKERYNLVGGGNLAGGDGVLLLARPEGLIGLGMP